MKKYKLTLYSAVMILLVVVEATAENKADNANQYGSNTGQTHIPKAEMSHQDSIIVNLDGAGKHRVEIKTEDEPGTMTWDAAVIAVQKYGEGWRLPTIDELRLMYEQRKRIGGFDNEDYWSAKEQDVNSAWIQGFRLGDQDRYNKQSKLKVRAVRSFYSAPA